MSNFRQSHYFVPLCFFFSCICFVYVDSKVFQERSGSHYARLVINTANSSLTESPSVPLRPTRNSSILTRQPLYTLAFHPTVEAGF